MTPASTLKTNTQVTYHDKKNVRTEGWIDAKDSVEISSSFGLGTTVPVKEFLTDSKYDGRFGSPQARLELIKSGGGSCGPAVGAFRFFQDNPTGNVCKPKGESEVYRAGEWAENVVGKAQDAYEARARQAFAENTIPGNSRFTDDLRDALIQDPNLREDHLVSALSRVTAGPSESVDVVLETARAFLRDNPRWTMGDLAELNRAMGNRLVADQLKLASEGQGVWSSLIARRETATIYLPTGKAADVLKI